MIKVWILVEGEPAAPPNLKHLARTHNTKCDEAKFVYVFDDDDNAIRFGKEVGETLGYEVNFI
jgi:hypothetical protein